MSFQDCEHFLTGAWTPKIETLEKSLLGPGVTWGQILSLNGPRCCNPQLFAMFYSAFGLTYLLVECCYRKLCRRMSLFWETRTRLELSLKRQGDVSLFHCFTLLFIGAQDDVLKCSHFCSRLGVLVWNERTDCCDQENQLTRTKTELSDDGGS